MSDKTVKNISKALGDALDDITFEPNPEMRKLKATFWTQYSTNPMMSKDKVTMAAIQEATNDTRIRSWWAIDGFKDWFCNKDEWRQKQEYLAGLAQDCAEKILLDPRANPNAKVALIKFITESVGKAEARIRETKMLDAQVHDMSPEQLQEFLMKNGVRLIPVKE